MILTVLRFGYLMCEVVDMNAELLMKKNWVDLIDQDLPEFGSITEESIRVAEQEPYRFRGSVRMSSGMIWTDTEYEIFRENELKKTLP